MSLKMVELDEEALYNQMIASMERELGEVLNPGDVSRITAGNILSVICNLINEGNANSKAQRLRYSFDTYLDELGDFVSGVTRLPPAIANVAVRFTISAPEGHTGAIMPGTLLTADGQRFFEIRETLPFSWQSPPLNTTAFATQGGAAYNGYPAGSINTIVRPIAYVKVVSTGPSVGGTDREDDDSYRERIRRAPRSFSAAGTDASYEFYAMSADSSIASVWSHSPSPSQVTITTLLKGGGIPTESILNKVKAAVSAREVKAVPDFITVSAPTIVNYDITAIYFISSIDAADELSIKAATEQAFEEYKIWQRSELGRAINVDQLRFMIMSAGAFRVDLQGPPYTALVRDSIAVTTSESVLKYGGIL